MLVKLTFYKSPTVKTMNCIYLFAMLLYMLMDAWYSDYVDLSVLPIELYSSLLDW